MSTIASPPGEHKVELRQVADATDRALFLHYRSCLSCQHDSRVCDEALRLRRIRDEAEALAREESRAPLPASSYRVFRSSRGGGSSQRAKGARSCSSACQRSKRPASTCHCSCHGAKHGRTP